MERPVQYFTEEYLEHCKTLSTAQILDFLESFRMLNASPGKLEQINIRVPSNTLKAFKIKSKSNGIQYQRKIKELMAEWVVKKD